MKLLVATYGTEGDARPFAALCRGLMDAGHEAHLLADAATLGSARALGVPVTALAGDIRGTLSADQAISGVVAKGGGFNATARALANIANANAQAWMRTLVEAGEGCDAILVAGLAAFVGLSAAEYLGAKGIGSGMIPLTPTAAFPSPFLPPRWVPRAFNRMSHGFVNGMLWKAFRGQTNAARAQFGQPARHAMWTDHPMVYGVSPSLLPAPGDWPANAQLCGQWLAPAAAWTPPPALEHFLAAGEAPVYIGFGSMTGFDNARLLEALIEAMQGRRTLFYPGWSGIDPKALPGNVFAIGETPHDWLFPRTAAVIHHGGSGTAHSAARAGVPSIVTPFAGDQFFWAERLRLAGVAPKAVNGRKPEARAFASALDFVASTTVRERASALGESMRAENGVANAVAALERIVAGGR
ncbi:glycosyltransferase [Paraburkholderia unamae]|uniref:UDP:flavonoid glycosyltransferase YjiC (YdhE family) n=1 Tax=Paraburkholderia unamae TaxID=219649 RepID=A0ABX5KLP4_9BURK|nr:glycosyltransferase [Paraburkholderia unamae]PVX82921.1 UDP:flavonoid glycosyltransferase YjiC (YdhE family) [Paraburkholderia unamae]CAG9268932.1 UDP:flavonoid glycosyltransferase YjiC, YdhE family [Paraburkholderia unamae]